MVAPSLAGDQTIGCPRNGAEAGRGLRAKAGPDFRTERRIVSQVALSAGPCLRSDHPSHVSLPGREGRGWRVVAAGEGEEGIRPMRGVIMPGPVLPHAPALVPLLPVRPKPPQAQVAALLVELANMISAEEQRLRFDTARVRSTGSDGTRLSSACRRASNDPAPGPRLALLAARSVNRGRSEL